MKQQKQGPDRQTKIDIHNIKEPANRFVMVLFKIVKHNIPELKNKQGIYDIFNCQETQH